MAYCIRDVPRDRGAASVSEMNYRNSSLSVSSYYETSKLLILLLNAMNYSTLPSVYSVCKKVTRT